MLHEQSRVACSKSGVRNCIVRFDINERRWGALRKRRFIRRLARPVAMDYPNVT